MYREYNILKIPFVCTDLFIGDLQTLIYIITEYRMWPMNYLYKLIINSPALSMREISNVVINYVREYAGITISYLKSPSVSLRQELLIKLFNNSKSRFTLSIYYYNYYLRVHTLFTI